MDKNKKFIVRLHEFLKNNSFWTWARLIEEMRTADFLVPCVFDENFKKTDDGEFIKQDSKILLLGFH